MTRDEFYYFLENVQEEVMRKFRKKNMDYGKHEDVFFSFTETANRMNLSPEEVLLTLLDKHLVVLYSKKFYASDFEDRCIDVIVYMILLLAMYQEADKEQEA